MIINLSEQMIRVISRVLQAYADLEEEEIIETDGIDYSVDNTDALGLFKELEEALDKPDGGKDYE